MNTSDEFATCSSAATSARATEAHFVPVPCSEEGKLVVLGGLSWKRNKIAHYKPTGLTNLRDELFCNFLKDMQLSIDARCQFLWRLVFASFILFAIAPIYLFSRACCIGVFLLVLMVLAWESQCEQKDLQCEIMHRTLEWQQLFRQEGFNVDCIINDTNWFPTSTCIHIHRRGLKNLCSTSGETLQKAHCQFEEEAKYLLVFVRLFRHRNKTFRVLPLANKAFSDMYVRPPMLYNLSEDSFRNLIREIAVALHEFSSKKQKRRACLLVIWLLFALFTRNETLGLQILAIFMLFDELILDCLPFQSSSIQTKIKECAPHLEVQGFVVEYRVDQPVWYNWREGYVHIRRLAQDVS